MRDAARLVLGREAAGDPTREPAARATPPEVMACRQRRERARVVDEAGQVADAGRLDDAVEETVDAERAVVEPPRTSEQDGGVVAGERGELAAVRALVQREEDQRETRVVAAGLE